MVIMAAEAAKQLAQANSDRPIKGYRVSKAYFLAALVIPTSAEGVETHLHLRPIQDDSIKDSTIWDYHLYSCENGQWHENSHGRIAAEYETLPNDVAGSEEPERLARSQKNHRDAEARSKWVLSRAEFYKSLWNSGYTFGPSFRAMDNVTFSDSDGWQSTADVNCFDWHAADNANHFQEHIIHPTTADGVIQTSLAVMARGGAGIFPTAVPIEVEDFWVSSSGLAHPQTQSVKSRARLLTKGNTGFEASVTALDSSLGKVLLHAKRFRLRFVTAMGSVQQQDHEPHMCYHLQWKPDIDFFSPSSPSLVSCPLDQEVLNKPTALSYVEQFLELATFKNPNMKILHFSAGLDGSQSLLLDQFFAPKDSDKPVLCHEIYMLTDLSGMEPEELRMLLEQYGGLKSTSWDMTRSLSSEEFIEDSFDLVFLSYVS
jgi:hypothetical protein